MSQLANSLQKYQQQLQQSKDAAIRQMDQQASVDPSPAAENTPDPKKVIGVMDQVIQVMEDAKQYGQDVLTLKKAWEGLKQNDGFLDQAISRGASDFVNQMWLGHPATFYPTSSSPTYHQQDAYGGVHGPATQPQEPSQPSVGIDATSPERSSLALYQNGMMHEQGLEHQQEMER